MRISPVPHLGTLEWKNPHGRVRTKQHIEAESIEIRAIGS
jgi:hypothetical protein